MYFWILLTNLEFLHLFLYVRWTLLFCIFKKSEFGIKVVLVYTMKELSVFLNCPYLLKYYWNYLFYEGYISSESV